MREGVQRSQDRHPVRHRGRQLRVKNGIGRKRRGVPTGHLLVRLIPTDHRVTLAFASGSSRSWNANKGEKGSPSRAVSLVIAHSTPVSQKKITALCGVHTAPSTKAHKAIRPNLAGKFHRSKNVALLRILARAIIDRAGNSCLFKQSRGSAGVAGRGHALIGNKQYVSTSALADTRRELRERAGAAHQLRTGSGCKGLHPESAHCGKIPLNGAPPEQKLEQIAFVWLLPLNPVGREGANIEPLDIG